MRMLITSGDWLHVFRQPAYAPNLDPAEGAWSHRNAASATSPTSTISKAIITMRLKRAQHRPDLIDAFLT
jgi:hypothetical protein